MKKILAVILLLQFSSSCSLIKGDSIEYFKPRDTDKVLINWDNMVGKWYGVSIIENGDRREIIEERNSDGTFTIEFHTIDKNTGEISVQKEMGEWAISGNIYFTIVKFIINDENENEQIDPTDPYFKDAYKIIKLTNSEFICKSVVNGDKYSSKKVDSNYTFQFNVKN